MRTLVKIKFGSHLYGTDTENSDLDYKSIFIPDANDILLQRVKGSINHARSKGEGEKNYAGEIDEEQYSLQKFLHLCAEGQTVSMDILFAPYSSWLPFYDPYRATKQNIHSYEWSQIIKNRDKLLTKKSASFVGYCRQQANKYGIKGSRVDAADKAYKFLLDRMDIGHYSTKSKLQELAGSIGDLVENNPDHMELIDIPGPTHLDGSVTVIRHWAVCGRKMPYTQTIKEATEVMRRIVDEYGKRARQAQQQEGVDWKALSHAVRVGNEAIELFKTGFITFPLINRKHILDVKLGRVSYQEVAEEIEQLLEEVESEGLRSTLPDSANKEWIDNFVIETYRKEIFNS